MLRTSAAALIVVILIGGPVVARPSIATSSTPKATSVLKQTNTTKTQKNASKPVVRRDPRHPVMYHRGKGRRHLAGRGHMLGSHGHTQSNGSQKTSKIGSNTNAQK